MHAPVRPHWKLLAGLLGTCSVALIAAAANIAVPPAPTLTVEHSVDGLPLLPTPVAAQRDDDAEIARAVGYFYPQLLTNKQQGRPHVWAVVNERGEVSHIDMEISPWWDRDGDFERNWREHQQRAGVIDSRVRQQLVVHVPVGPNHAVVAWVLQLGAVAQDLAAPTLAPAPRQAQTMEARLLSTADAQRLVIEHFDPAALSEGVPAGQELWFLIDPDGRALQAGRRAVITDPQASRVATQKLFPASSVGYIARGTVVKDATGKRVPVTWQWLERTHAQDGSRL